jgi:hypothetical protein
MASGIVVGAGEALASEALTAVDVADGDTCAVWGAAVGTGVSGAGSAAGWLQASISGAAKIKPPPPAARRSNSLRLMDFCLFISRAVPSSL